MLKRHLQEHFRQFSFFTKKGFWRDSWTFLTVIVLRTCLNAFGACRRISDALGTHQRAVSRRKKVKEPSIVVPVAAVASIIPYT